MALARIAVLIAAGLFMAVPAASAAPPSCDAIADALEVQSDSAKVAEDLDTTRARVNACIKRRRIAQRHAERRSRLFAERAERGIQ